MKYFKVNKANDRNVNFVFLWQLIKLACDYKIVCKLSFYAFIMIIRRIDFGKVSFYAFIIIIRRIDFGKISFLIVFFTDFWASYHRYIYKVKRFKC